MLLPKEPGLRRRLVYSENIRKRTQHMYNTHTIAEDDISELQNVDIPYNNFSIFDPNYEYREQAHLEDSGLNVKMLVKNSSIIICKSNFFCSICHQDHHYDNKNDKILRKLKCDHVFHIICIETWLSTKKSCPICRKNLNFI